jgi:hypothetical protein
MIEKKEFIVKNEPAFRLTIRHWKATNPSNLNAVEFVQDCMRDGEVDFTSTYQFVMTNEEIKQLIKGLENVVE